MNNKQENVNFGILTYNSINIGDEIQSLAAMRFLPRIDSYVYREKINLFKPSIKTKLLMNAWWMWKPENFSIDKNVDALFTSVHIRETIFSNFEKKMEIFSKFAPIGCRDLSTCEYLKSHNIQAYFSGCLTLTLQRNYNIPKQDYILCVDVPQKVIDVIKTRTSRPVYDISRFLSPYCDSKERFELAKVMLSLYHNAHLVVSPRMHVILPSLALETNVLEIKTREASIKGAAVRYMGYVGFANYIDIDNHFEELYNYDFDNPPKNPTKHLKYREELIKKCSDFTGYNNTESLIETDFNPLIKLVQLNAYKKENIGRIVYWANIQELLQALYYRLQGFDRYDLVDNEIVDKNSIIKFLLYIKNVVNNLNKKFWNRLIIILRYKYLG